MAAETRLAGSVLGLTVSLVPEGWEVVLASHSFLSHVFCSPPLVVEAGCGVRGSRGGGVREIGGGNGVEKTEAKKGEEIPCIYCVKRSMMRGRLNEETKEDRR